MRGNGKGEEEWRGDGKGMSEGMGNGEWRGKTRKDPCIFIQKYRVLVGKNRTTFSK